MSEDFQNATQLRTGAVTRTGYSLNTITVATGEVQELEEILKLRIANAPEGFFDEAPIVIDVSEVADLRKIDYVALCELFRRYHVFLIGLSGVENEHRAHELTSRNIPIVNSSRFVRIREENFKPRVITQRVEVKIPQIIRDPEPMMVIRRNVRSGESIQAPDNSVCIMGTVANGARIIASHNVLVLGDLFGEIYAGSPKSKNDPGFQGSFIFCQGRFAPTLIAINGNYQTADDMEQEQVSSAISSADDQQMRGLIVTLDGSKLKYGRSRDYTNFISNL